jgi:hypothetical protein
MYTYIYSLCLQIDTFKTNNIYMATDTVDITFSVSISLRRLRGSMMSMLLPTLINVIK